MGERDHYGEVWTACHFLDERSVAAEQGASNGDSFQRPFKFPRTPSPPPFTHTAQCCSVLKRRKKSMFFALCLLLMSALMVEASGVG